MNSLQSDAAESDFNGLSSQVIGAAIEVHRALGSGLLESAYAACLARELESRSIHFEREVGLPIEFKGIRLDCGYRMDFVIASKLIVEVKAVEALHPLHSTQLLTYLRLSRLRLGLLLNFHAGTMKQGIKRVVNNF